MLLTHLIPVTPRTNTQPKILSWNRKRPRNDGSGSTLQPLLRDEFRLRDDIDPFRIWPSRAPGPNLKKKRIQETVLCFLISIVLLYIFGFFRNKVCIKKRFRIQPKYPVRIRNLGQGYRYSQVVDCEVAEEGIPPASDHTYSRSTEDGASEAEGTVRRCCQMDQNHNFWQKWWFLIISHDQWILTNFFCSFFLFF